MLEPTIIIAATALVGLTVVVFALLMAWRGWLALKELELSQSDHSSPQGSNLGAARIEISDLKERIRKLEAIASGVEW